jgi:hypothetical protein
MSDAVMRDAEGTGEIRLELDYAATTLFEIPSAVLKVPAPLSPVEVRPGVGLVSLTVCLVKEGGVHGEHGPLPAYAEAVWCVHVEPDLRAGVPDLSMYVLCFAATDRSALVANADHHKLAVLPEPIQVEVDEHNVRLLQDGRIFASVSCGHPAPKYKPRNATLQVFTHRGQVHRYNERFEAHSFRHQRRKPCAELEDHPFFCGLPVQGLKRPYLQWLCAPRQPLTQVASVPTVPVLEML